ncbi:hypothetical protein BHF71_03155 [Vulcanibacillus modesticaldus]|uniref:SpoOB alpha-helical domain-containing protein n=1 Tax=Vulcanibacillus modesticaldus TaxID=337097 RepID=A0A1D2YSP0_9BACI|nr:Spo0B domain-containing protein [Vulcanibacillus modesticaldus]OEF98033.1 hypothetical protein BHF71_03155 [Vulcanibacillus modesticaldus]
MKDLFRNQKKWESNDSDDFFDVAKNEELIQVLRKYRHDWLNHLQIIFGYATLKKSEEIISYIKKINHSSRREAIISSFNNVNLAAYLLKLTLDYQELFIELELEESVPSKEKYVDGDLVLVILKKFVDIFNEAVTKNEDQKLYISISGTNNYLIIKLEFEGNTKEISQAIHNLGEEFNNQNGEFFININNDDEFVLELHFLLNQ